MKCYLDVFFEISSLRRIVEVQNVIVGAVLRQKKKTLKSYAALWLNLKLN